MTSAQTVRILAYAVLGVALAGAVYCAAELLDAAHGDRFSEPQRVLFRRIVAVKLAGIALFVLDLGGQVVG
jgi:hypothetical protein